MAKTYSLPPLPYKYNALEPHISEQNMTLHHDKHHQAYVNGANAALDKLEKARAGAMQVDVRGVLRDLSFNIDGHKLHTIFWPNMAPAGKGGGKPGGRLADKMDQDFGGFDKFKAQFSDACKTVEGSGCALLLHDREIDSLVLTQIEKQNFMQLAELPILLGAHDWEHSYYLQYLHHLAKYVQALSNVVNCADV